MQKSYFLATQLDTHQVLKKTEFITRTTTRTTTIRPSDMEVEKKMQEDEHTKVLDNLIFNKEKRAGEFYF